MAIKGVLREELGNSERMLKKYNEELAKLPKGSLIKKNIKGHEYYYLVMREDGKVNWYYKGKEVPAKTIKEYARAKELRAKYRKLISQLKKQIRYLKGTLRGQESV